MNGKPRFILCNCTGECPGFKDMNFWQLLNYVRNELESEYAVLHPQLCMEDGERFLLEILKPDTLYIIGACDPRMQKKMFRDAFEKAGLSFDALVIPLDLRAMTTEKALEKVKEAYAQAQARITAQPGALT
jgi:heterodisulfide reductase subunit A-like polyferredoxin